MRTIITVTEYSTLPGFYRVKSDLRERGSRFAPSRDARGAAAAAAVAMEYAQRVGAGGYCIFAPKDVLDMIPDDMRSRG